MAKPDYETMERFISAIQKLVIKDVVQFTDRKLDTYKSIVPNLSFKSKIIHFANLNNFNFCETVLNYYYVITIYFANNSSSKMDKLCVFRGGQEGLVPNADGRRITGIPSYNSSISYRRKMETADFA